MTSGVMNGKLLGVYLDGTLIATAKSCKLAISHEVRDTFTKDDAGWKTNAEGARSWKVDVDGLVTQTNFSTLFGLMTNRTQVTVSISVANGSH
jgi:hypothetical protein